jgi:hypothetical protein
LAQNPTGAKQKMTVTQGTLRVPAMVECASRWLPANGQDSRRGISLIQSAGSAVFLES